MFPVWLANSRETAREILGLLNQMNFTDYFQTSKLHEFTDSST